MEEIYIEEERKRKIEKELEEESKEKNMSEKEYLLHLFKFYRLEEILKRYSIEEFLYLYNKYVRKIEIRNEYEIYLSRKLDEIELITEDTVEYKKPEKKKNNNLREVKRIRKYENMALKSKKIKK